MVKQLSKHGMHRGPSLSDLDASGEHRGLSQSAQNGSQALSRSKAQGQPRPLGPSNAAAVHSDLKASLRDWLDKSLLAMNYDNSNLQELAVAVTWHPCYYEIQSNHLFILWLPFFDIFFRTDKKKSFTIV